MRRSPVWKLCLALVVVLPPLASRAAVTAETGLGGHVLAEVDGRTIAFPTLKAEITGDLQGDLATITVRQVFANPTRTPLNARYLFPLNKDAAVHAMQMRVGDEVVEAKIAKRESARRRFERAKQAGKSAALLEQHRPNMFTQEIANLMPGMPVTITLRYSQVVPRVDGAYELHVPLVVGPRYIPLGQEERPQMVRYGPDSSAGDEPPGAGEDESLSNPAAAFGDWRFGQVPDYPDVAGLTIPPLVSKDRVSLDLSLQSGIPIRDVASATHSVAVSGDKTSKRIVLGGDATIDNRDFVLRYGLAARRPQAGLLTHFDPDGNTFSLLIEPPKAPQGADITPRELVFVLDTSGSMSGAPMEASKTFMRHALKTLRPADYFRIIRFANDASGFSANAVTATRRNVAAGTAYVDGLWAGGGTEILTGLRRAYSRPAPANALRIVVFLSDGYVGNEPEILRLVAGEVGKGRLYAFGVGTAVNRYLISEMARQGRGISRIIDPTSGGQEEAVAFAGRLRTPVLTDIQIDWGDLAPHNVTPAYIPDLFDGDSIRIQGRYTAREPQIVTVKGRVNGRPVGMPLKIDPAADSSPDSQAIPLVWARSRIADHMREMMVPMPLRRSGLSDPELQITVTALGLAHSLVTQWTSFVAVSRKVVNPDPAMAISKDVPLPMVEGVSEHAYPKQQRVQLLAPPTPGQRGSNPPASAVAFSGGGTPEPEFMLGLVVLLLTMGGTLAHWLRKSG